MTDRIAEGIRYLATEFSATPDEFRRDNGPGAEMLMDALLSHGYAVQTGGRLAASRVGLRRLEDVEVGEVEAA